jgi:hypothetical protein
VRETPASLVRQVRTGRVSFRFAPRQRRGPLAGFARAVISL